MEERVNRDFLAVISPLPKTRSLTPPSIPSKAPLSRGERGRGWETLLRAMPLATRAIASSPVSTMCLAMAATNWPAAVSPQNQVCSSGS